MAPNTRVMPSPMGPTQLSMNPRSRDSPLKPSRDGGSGSDNQPSRVPVMNLMRDHRQTSERSMKSHKSEGSVRHSMSFYHLLRELRPTGENKYSVITFVLTVVASLVCYLPFYAYQILASSDSESVQGGIAGMTGLDLDASVGSSSHDTDSALFHAINR